MPAADVVWKFDDDGSVVVKFPAAVLSAPEAWEQLRTHLVLLMMDRDMGGTGTRIRDEAGNLRFPGEQA